MTRALKDSEIHARLEDIPGWTHQTGALRYERKTRSFRAALDIANAIGDIADEHNHHPDLHVSWGCLIVEIRTHDLGNKISNKDFQLAAAVHSILVA